MIELASFYDNLHYEDGEKPAVKTMIKSPLAKEIRLLFRDGQVMHAHKAPHPIVVQVMEGAIDFGVEGERYVLKKGMMIVLDSNVPHDLIALEESMVRLSLNLQDQDSRVHQV
ncbi:cupin domain-containing protein [Chitinophaga sp. sic0106]|uniref:cupin domain-containing protein n=1 Tax=Chitinophaga sp. sic0106 TaxID=2854785 RepID=UPI001C491F9E|nr:cupin domain-containing protein [Chitinophaga sp. sic0106]MBV7530670.1 cupin domain-containing protein [Chitinophaga sp. sic0106]